MPCATIHLLLAGRMLDDWRAHPGRAPFPASRPEAARAFLHGALAPDMGFVPGTDRLVSEAAHYLAPADLSRGLIASAGTIEEIAFAWGWATHVVGDVEIHPLVGRAVGEALHGDPARRVDALEDVATHVSLEVGLDITFFASDPSIPRPPSGPHFDGRGIRHLAEALEETYGVGWNPARLLADHRRAVSLTRWWPNALGLLGRRPIPARPVIAILRRAIGREGAARGFFHPRRPQGWVVEEVRRIAADFPRTFQDVVDDGLAGMANRNLETGGPAGAGLGHPATEIAQRRLGARGAGRAITGRTGPARTG